jgi:molybdenum cofactor synthesis domain-containing protein
MLTNIHFAILITSDRSASGLRPDLTGSQLKELIEERHGVCQFIQVIPDDPAIIEEILLDWSRDDAIDVILTSGGTGIGARDVTVDVTLRLIEKEIPGFGEEMRRRSLEVTPYAILSRAAAGIVHGKLLVNLPGSPKGAVECLTWLLKPIIHAVQVLKKEITDCQANDGKNE